MGRVSLPRLHDGPCQINDKKLADLRSLLDFISPVYHSFYQELSGCAGDDLDWNQISLTQKAKLYSHNLIVYIAPPVINNIMHNMKPNKWLNVFNNYYIKVTCMSRVMNKS